MQNSNKGNKGIAEKLEEMAKQRYSEARIIKKDKDADATDYIIAEKKRKSKGKIQKTFYLSDELSFVLRKIAYEKNCDQNTIVTKAIENYLKDEGYL